MAIPCVVLRQTLCQRMEMLTGDPKGEICHCIPRDRFTSGFGKRAFLLEGAVVITSELEGLILTFFGVLLNSNKYT